MKKIVKGKFLFESCDDGYWYILPKNLEKKFHKWIKYTCSNYKEWVDSGRDNPFKKYILDDLDRLVIHQYSKRKKRKEDLALTEGYQ